MLSLTSVVLALALSSYAAPVPVRREVPQEHSHEAILTSVRTSLNLNNPDGIQDPVFGLLGNAAAAAGLGKIADATCLQQATADQAFTNAKAAKDVQGMTDALIYRALERNSGTVGGVTDKCTSIKAVNPEIAALSQHQDPASTGAAAVNKDIALKLAVQIASIGGDPLEALKSGTFAPGKIGDNTGKGNTCDDATDAAGCIFTQKLIQDDATSDEILAAVSAGGKSVASTSVAPAEVVSASATVSAVVAGSTCAPPTTVTVTAAGATATGASSVVSSDSSTTASASPAPASSTGAPTDAANVQKFTGALGGISAPAVTAGGRGFNVAGNDSFVNSAAALGRSCDVQHNQCANNANSAAGRAAGITVSQCDAQNNDCRAANP